MRNYYEPLTEKLLNSIALDLNIVKGDSETKKAYQCRLLYSALCRVAYASLFDQLEDSHYITIKHFKNRVKHTIEAYYNMYPNLMSDFTAYHLRNDFFNELLKLYRENGLIYHAPHMVTASAYAYCNSNRICFKRGQPLCDNISMSGGGAFSTTTNLDSTNSLSIYQYTGIEDKSLVEVWKSFVDRAVWNSKFEQHNVMEYLRLSNFSNGYWSNQKTSDGTTSIMRTLDQNPRIYYLYRVNDGKFEVSQLPCWIDENYSYRLLSNGLLKTLGVLPSIAYYVDGRVVYTKLSYLLPPKELSFYLLYSWPNRFQNIRDGFAMRTFSIDVFEEMKTLFQHRGYHFRKEDSILTKGKVSEL
jgi:hypothetical protein